MRWVKDGLIYRVCELSDWAWSHAHKPSLLFVEEDRLRIYFGVRDRDNRTRTTFIDVDPACPQNVLYVHDRPVLDLGPLGTFDDSGANVSSVLRHEGLVYLYYTGWNPSRTVPTRNSIGLAVSEDNGLTFRRLFDGPVMDRTIHEPYYTSTPFVLFDSGRWRMWYASGTQWRRIEGKLEICYHIKYAESADGVTWERPNLSCIAPRDDDEATARASVMRENEGYCMWYSYRRIEGFRENRECSYRIGYAESNDALTWERMDDRVGIDVSESGWDSEMIAYPAVYRHRGTLHMIYNGNGFGAAGFGSAHLDSQA